MKIVLFQALDDKKECVAIYLDGELLHKQLPDDLTKTWNYSKFLEDREVEYAKLYCHGKTLSEVCPDSFKEEWETINDRIKAFHRSFVEAKVSLRDNCFFDLVPDRYLLTYCDARNKITEHDLREYERPENYDHLMGIAKIAADIKHQDLNIDMKGVKITPKTRDFIKKVGSLDSYINYNIFGTKTGRLTTINGSFPILTMRKDLRKIIKPQNDCFLELDFNAAELRTVLSLLGQEQPSSDLHKWNNTYVYKGLLTRAEAKKRMFAWLYNPNSEDQLTKRFYDRGKIKDRFFSKSLVRTIFNREIKSDDYHAFNYIIQSTTSDLFLKQMIKIHNFLKDKKSFISFSLHDSLVIDFSKEDLKYVLELVTMFSDTELGKFLTNVNVGKSFGEMKEWKL